MTERHKKQTKSHDHDQHDFTALLFAIRRLIDKRIVKRRALLRPGRLDDGQVDASLIWFRTTAGKQCSSTKSDFDDSLSALVYAQVN